MIKRNLFRDPWAVAAAEDLPVVLEVVILAAVEDDTRWDHGADPEVFLDLD